MDYIIKDIDISSIDEALSLVRNVFMEIDAPDYSETGINEVMNEMIESDEFKGLFKTGEQKMIGAVMDNRIIGVLSIGKNDHISLCFVDKEHHRKGIAKALFGELTARLKKSGTKAVTLNSTPYAVPFYKAIGFEITGECIKKHGVLYTPMKLVI